MTTQQTNKRERNLHVRVTERDMQNALACAEAARAPGNVSAGVRWAIEQAFFLATAGQREIAAAP